MTLLKMPTQKKTINQSRKRANGPLPLASMTKHKDQRVAVLVDAANMYHSAKNLYKRRVNFKEVLKAAVADRRLVRAIAYVIRGASNDEEENFFEALSNQGFEVIIKDLQVFSGGARKADWDVGIAVDAIKMADHADVIVLVSGDGDYIPLVDYLQSKGCRVEAMAFRQTTSSKLIEEVDDFVSLSDSRKFLIGR